MRLFLQIVSVFNWGPSVDYDTQLLRPTSFTVMCNFEPFTYSSICCRLKGSTPVGAVFNAIWVSMNAKVALKDG